MQQGPLISADRESIFGDTYDGVPNPNVPHVHPYPTRYHGPNWTIPNAAQSTYRIRPYAVPPYAGFGAAPLGNHITGNGAGDAVLGGAIGAVAAITGSMRPMDMVIWPAVTATLMYLAGAAGLLGAGAALLWTQSKRKG
jgi:hypothetical protein